MKPQISNSNKIIPRLHSSTVNSKVLNTLKLEGNIESCRYSLNKSKILPSKVNLTPSKTYHGLGTSENYSDPIFGFIKNHLILKFPYICSESKDELKVEKASLICLQKESIKNVLKNIHMQSPFRLAKENSEKENENQRVEKIENNRTNNSENIKTQESEKPIISSANPENKIENSKAVYLINNSIINKNYKYIQKTFELIEDTGDYQPTIFDDIKPENFLESYNDENEHNDIPIDNQHIEQEIQNIYQKICLCSIKKVPLNQELKANSNQFDFDEGLKNSMNIPNSIKATKNLGDNRSYLFRLPLDLRSPLKRKIIICRHNHDSNKFEICHAIVTSGYISQLSIQFSKYKSKNNFAFVNINDEEVPINNLINSSILKSLFTSEVKQISCGFDRCIVLTRDGIVASWGYGLSGCLGHGNYVTYTSPKIIKSLDKKILYVECGAYHNGALSEDGDIYLWGRGDVGQLGTKVKNNDTIVIFNRSQGFAILVPTVVLEFKNQVKGFALGEAHTLILDIKGKVWSSGWNEHGQLGRNPQKDIIYEFGLIDLLDKIHIISVSAGSLTSSAISKDHEVL